MPQFPGVQVPVPEAVLASANALSCINFAVKPAPTLASFQRVVSIVTVVRPAVVKRAPKLALF